MYSSVHMQCPIIYTPNNWADQSSIQFSQISPSPSVELGGWYWIMATTVIEGELPFRILGVEESSSSSAFSADWHPTDAVIFFGISLVLGIACRHILRGTRVPYTVALLILGIALGSLGLSIASNLIPFVFSILWLVFSSFLFCSFHLLTYYFCFCNVWWVKLFQFEKKERKLKVN